MDSNPISVDPSQPSQPVPDPSPYAPPHRPRIWTTFAVASLSLVSFLVASAVMSILAIGMVFGGITLDLVRDPQSYQAVMQSRLGLFVMVVLPQFALVLPSLVAAGFSPEATLKRLGLVRGHWPLWAWLGAVLCAPFVSLLSGLVVGSFMDESETLKQMSDAFRSHGESGFLIPLALMIGGTPAVCEELLFRGYMQTRLTRSMPPVIGIALVSMLFAAFHLDVVHVIAVFPIGLFLGWVTWRSGSLFPAMFAHFANNVVSVMGVVFAPQDETAMLGAPATAISVSLFGSGLLGVVMMALAAKWYQPPIEGRTVLASTPPTTDDVTHTRSIGS